MNDIEFDGAAADEAPRKRRKNGADPLPPPTTAEVLARGDDKSIMEWFTELAGSAPIQIKVKRLHPRIWRGKQVGGILDTLDQFVSEEEMKELYGGGKYEIRVFRQHQTGKWVFGGQRTIEIAGDPRLDNLPMDDGGAAAVPAIEDSSLQKHVLGIAERMSVEDRRRAERLEVELRDALSRNGTDPALLQAITGPLQAQVTASQETMREMQKQLDTRNRETLEMLTKKGDSTTDRLLEKMLMEEQSRMATLRAAHETELRTMRESMLQDTKRAEDRADRLLEQNERTHQREIDSIKRSYEGQIDNLKLSYDSRIDSLKAELNRIGGELKQTKEEVITLRDKKEQPLEDQLARFLQLKELLGGLAGGNEEEGSILERIIDRATPIVEGIGARIAAAGPTEAPQVQAAQKQVTVQPQADKGGPPAKPITVDAAELGQAIVYIENAISNDVDPVVFAKSVANMVPKSIIDLLRAQGVDGLINGIAQQNPNSPIVTQNGRNFMRRVAKILNDEAKKPA